MKKKIIKRMGELTKVDNMRSRLKESLNNCRNEV
jgi:hypothetical protein